MTILALVRPDIGVVVGRWFALVLLVFNVACPAPSSGGGGVQSAQPSSGPEVASGRDTKPPVEPASTPGRIELSFFGSLSVAEGELLLLDGGTHGVQGHRLRVGASGPARWRRLMGSVHPDGRAWAGKLRLSPDERNRLLREKDRVWTAIGDGGRARFDPPLEEGPPRWVWAIVIRRGDEVRVMSGGDDAPASALPLLTFLRQRVDAEAALPVSSAPAPVATSKPPRGGN